MEMTMERFPALASVFAKYHIDSMLETHCFLMFEKERLDVTFPQEITYPQASDYLEEWEITPEEIGSRKVKRHQEGMKRWMKEKNIPYPFEQVWKIREECIDRLSENTTS